MKKQIRTRALVAILCIAVFMSLSASAIGVFAHDMNGDLGGGITREGDGLLPDTNNGEVTDPAPDDGIIPAPDTDPDTDGKTDNDTGNDTNKDNDNNNNNNNNNDNDGVIGDMDKDDAKPDDDADITDDKKDDGDGKKFSRTGLVVALIIAAAVIILIIVMIPSAKRTGDKSSSERKK